VISPTKLSIALDKAASSSDFGADGWLTFCLCGEPAKLRALADDLAALHARNLEGAEGGFLYAKLPVQLDVSDIQRIEGFVSGAAERHGIIIDHIDLDSSPDIGGSKSFSLIEGHR